MYRFLYSIWATVTLMMLVSCQPFATPTPDINISYSVKQESYRVEYIGTPFEIPVDNCGAARDSTQTESRSQKYLTEVNVDVSSSIAGELGGDIKMVKVVLEQQIGIALGIKAGAETEATSSIQIVTPAGKRTLTSIQWKETWTEGEVAISRPDGSYIGVLPFAALNSLTLEQLTSKTIDCVTGAVITAQPSLALPQPNPTLVLPCGSGRLTFVSNKDGNNEIYAINLDGSQLINLTNNLFDDSIPSWSPNGNQIAFETNRDGNYEIYIMNSDGSQPRRITNTPYDEHDPDWSPSGSQLVYHANGNEVWQVWRMNSDGTNQKPITNNSEGDWAASWSPDGQHIAFASNSSLKKGDIYVVDLGNSNLVNLTHSEAHDSVPHWSPDGSQLAFYSERDGNREIYLMNSDGTGLKRLTSNGIDDALATWSPNGQCLAFSSARGDVSEIYTMRIDGSNVTRITNLQAVSFNPVWYSK